MSSISILIRFMFILNVLLIIEPHLSSSGAINYSDYDSLYSPKQWSESTAELEENCDTCPYPIRCVAPIQCPAHVAMKSDSKPKRCRLRTNKMGYCCVTGQNHTESRQSVSRLRLNRRNFGILRDIVHEARHMVQEMAHKSLHSVRTDSSEFMHHLVFQSPIVDSMKDNRISNWALEQIFTGQLFKKKEHMPADEIFNSIDTNDQDPDRGCISTPKCASMQLNYRTADGTCNNPLPERSFWGAAGQPGERLIAPAYEDGIWAARQHSVDGSLLTSPRSISTTILPDVDRPHNRVNLLFMQFGQFISHDFIQSAPMRHDDGTPIQCCSEDGSRVLSPNDRHFACMPIAIDRNDEFFRKFNQGCINMVRLSLAPYFNCRIGYGKQINKVTHFLDASGVYGSSLEAQSLLRSFQGGKLQLPGDEFGENLLPITTRNESCGGTQQGKICFLSGDGRTNQIISLTALHTIFAREHNRIAEILGYLNPHQTDEVVFQEARRIVIAEMQHIIYAEYLPLLVGTSAMQKFGLYLETTGYSTDYDPDTNPATIHEFTGAAYRFGHSTVDGKFKIQSEDGSIEIINIPDVMFNPGRLRENRFLDTLMVTLLSQGMQKVDNSITYGLSRFMFRGNKPFGIDLAALNIQRGRDLGLRSYNDYLELIGSKRIRRFEEFGEMSNPLRLVYHHPDDIDLWIGGLLEPIYQDAAVGQLFSEIIAEQFSRFRRGDRYFYNNDPRINPGHFTPCQLQEIRKASIARIICDNLNSLQQIQPFAFLKSDYPGNDLIRCSDLREVNLECWRT